MIDIHLKKFKELFKLLCDLLITEVRQNHLAISCTELSPVHTWTEDMSIRSWACESPSTDPSWYYFWQGEAFKNKLIIYKTLFLRTPSRIISWLCLNCFCQLSYLGGCASPPEGDSFCGRHSIPCTEHPLWQKTELSDLQILIFLGLLNLLI